MQESIRVENTKGVATITLNRPEVFNSFNREMALRLQNELDKAANSVEIRAIMLILSLIHI